ncbi:hypothetical protein O6H91_15G082900 [Diphasiastrum complanatum]|uniref:Uncharacterized protein n=1 Tax=Diphasiastrum complanatum TaxID=34168 RepID=A0ACC2BK40_DIPCM|nr:hypothetical protein O6H91_15G082900 [Diphasiastrum complanatum]
MGVSSDEKVLVQDLKIDPAYVVSPEFRPNKGIGLCEDVENIPVIDLTPVLAHYNHEPQALGEVVAQVEKAAVEWGFFQVVNHGVPLTLLDEVEAEAKKFFELPIEEKRKVQRTFDCPLGYYDGEFTKNVKDWKEVFDFAVQGSLDLPKSFYDDEEEVVIHKNQWPDNPPKLRESCENWASAVERLAFKLVELLSLSLGLPANYFNKYFENHSASIRLNYYDKCPSPDLVLGVSRHKDGGGLTVLVQDEVGGLEVRRRDGEWIRVFPRRDAFVINIGALFQVWSNNKYQSIEHRVVVNEHKERFSVPFFFNPSHKSNIAPIPILLDSHNFAKYHPINWGKFRKMKNDGNFKNLGIEDLQIEHYAIKA